MKRTALTLLLLWPLVGAPLPALTQSPELKAAVRQYQALKAQGKCAEAEKFVLEALKLGEAEPLFKQALGVIEKALGPDHPDVGTS